ncbi:hypothetical protein AB0F91_33955 [Amycolatopsis sp. NPDC023774]|uniref:hypothetical protein n=1 Tax=Amycolatopsis sp. NPDC023774 TaxID=3155015 RepID=UPI0033D9B18B
MGAGFEVVPATVSEAAGHAHRAAATVRPVDLAGPLSGMATGMPGGTSVTAAAQLSDVWHEAVPRWATDTDAYGEQLDDAARGYRGTERQATDDVNGAGR